MCDHKLSSEEVPKKFTEWLLAMGCPPEKVPTQDKVVEMCRGQYYMVWRSLMEHVEPKDVIRQKRLHVFCDDVYKWKRKNAFNKPDKSTIMPAELVLWHQHSDVKEKVASAEERVLQARQNLNQLMEKISTKMSHRNLSRRSLQNVQRRAWLLQQVAKELSTKKENLEETRAIADSLCSTDEEVDVQSKLEKYMISSRRGSAAAASTSLLASNPVASSSVVSNGDISDGEEQVSCLVRCRGGALWPALLRRRASLAPLALHDAARDTPGENPSGVVAHTAGMHCALALEALKNKAHIKQARHKLAAAVADLNTSLSGEACELLVVRCEEARAGARVTALQTLLAEVTSRDGLFGASGCDVTEDRRATTKQIAAVDKAIEIKKEELKRLVASLAATEKKIYNVRECLINIFNGFHKDVSLNENDRLRGHFEFPQESVATMRQFYEEHRERRKRSGEISMDLDVSEHASFADAPDNPKFADELRIYLKKFNLEKNRKLVLESGEKIWLFEALSEAALRLQSCCHHSSEASGNLLCPSVSLSRGLHSLLAAVEDRALLETALAVTRKAVDKPRVHIDISLKSMEDALVDKIKKRLSENLLSLQKTNKTLDLGQENLKFWSGNEMKKFISHERMIDGKCYKDYEDMYIINLN